ncbi:MULTISPECIES: pyruvate decarboxylase [unclassified Streptomyces]|uniref:pyruvate decarboxylase n=1 Tax=unclassified Streptomyces TaxID=2593676 RepID=UPI003D8E4444
MKVSEHVLGPLRDWGLEHVLAGPGDGHGVWEAAPVADKPCVFDFMTGPAVPPISPHVTPDQIEAVACVSPKGDGDRVALVRQGPKPEGQELPPGSRHRRERPGTEDDQ